MNALTAILVLSHDQSDRARAEVVLRAVIPSDLDHFFAHQQDQAACHQAAFTAPDPSDRGAFDSHWGTLLGNERILVRTILVDHEVVGHIARFWSGDDAEITYWIGRGFWGRGIATAALRFFLEVDSTRPLFARVAHDNLPSVRVLEKCGFKQVGTDRYHAHARKMEIDEIIFRRDE